MKALFAEKDSHSIREEVQKEFPDDPALQAVHVARKIIAREAEQAGLSFIEYVRVWKKKQEEKTGHDVQ